MFKTQRALLLYTLMVLPLYCGIGWQLRTHLIAAPGADPKQWIWFLMWWPHALLNHLNPWRTPTLWAPHGTTIAWATSTPLQCIAMTPITLLAGPYVAYNVMVGITIIANALAARYLALAIRCRPLPALLVGAGFAMSPFAMTELMGRICVFTTWPMTLLVALYILYLDNTIADLTFQLLAAALATAQAYTSMEPAVTLALMGFLTLGTLIIISPHHRTTIIESIPVCAGTGALTLMASWPILWAMLSAYHTPGQVFQQQYTAADLLNFIIPTPVTELGGQMWQCVTRSFQTVFQQQDAYIGLPALTAMAYLLHKNWRHPASRIFLTAFLIAVALALGTHLEIAGIVTPVPMPMALAHPLPLLNKIIPVRIAQYSTLATLLAIAYFWPVKPKQPRIHTFAASLKSTFCHQNLAAGAICLSLVPCLSFNYWQTTPCNPRFFRTNAYKKYLHPAQLVLILPEMAEGNAALYQAEDHFYWNSAAGWIGAATPHPLYLQRINKHRILGWLKCHHCRTVIVPLKWCRRERRRQITTQLTPLATVDGVEIFKDTQPWPDPNEQNTANKIRKPPPQIPTAGGAGPADAGGNHDQWNQLYGEIYTQHNRQRDFYEPNP